MTRLQQLKPVFNMLQLALCEGKQPDSALDITSTNYLILQHPGHLVYKREC